MKRKSKKKFPESHENATFRRFKAFMLEVVIFLSEHCPKIVKRNDVVKKDVSIYNVYVQLDYSQGVVLPSNVDL
ncbi:hypothetical protein QE152_g27038 [Popillia japonica]|uniref:Transposase n=1 Tax=Popillia japonica TaxID=7064 RepID=A0AAW1JVS4_POPJA